ncbi:alpha-amylase family glycosyl hydrolase [uncultured Alloprevotella sp.]|mgnify:FL=1|uniref:alpha-amylase family glycosyl hydrolase n=1 Tax=uncultured Alloprevotella sp. TaxID=1283315 RepID=UPI00262BE66E|nr:alpha-amylase family glycosyl hydrolase [uncultured Alloprevotella sp.]
MAQINIYQVLPRLYGNTRNNNTHNGTLTENGCGKFADFTSSRLKKLQQNGYTHIWYTGLIAHATQTIYPYLPQDNPEVVKGKAGSPYAIKDYYDVDPDLATITQNRMQEFEALVERTHKAGLKMLIDFVPNHVSRQYHSLARPTGISDLGQNDDTTQAFKSTNNFYYCPSEELRLNDILGHEGSYKEFPAKATGNDHFDAQPGKYDWYETIKLNYGVNYFDNHSKHFDPTPDTWLKMTDILLYWAQKGVDGFRCDMAEMVPVEFWNFALTRLKADYPHLIFIAEVYNPSEYRNYLQQGKFDYLYDKVGLYDTLRAVVCGQSSAAAITSCWQAIDDIRPQMLNFLENHDEQRIASDFFAADPFKALPALVVSTCLSTNPFMVYAGQELGERGMDDEGFSGHDGRTTIFDYWTVSSYLKLLKGKSSYTAKEKKLSNYYTKLLQIRRDVPAISQGKMFDLMYVNNTRENNFNPDKQYAFLRSDGKQHILIIANFDANPTQVGLCIPAHAFDYLSLKAGKCRAQDLLTGEKRTLDIERDKILSISLPANGATLLSF